MQRIIIKSYETKKSLITPIVFLIIGLVLAINPGEVVEFISFIFGGVFLFLGILKFITDRKRNDTTTSDEIFSFIMIIMGIICIFFSSTIELLVRLILGLWILLNGINTVIIGTDIIKIDKKNIFTLLVGFFLMAMGLYTMFIENLVFETIGIVIIIYSILEIIDYFILKINLKRGILCLK